jgi:hypothetical protein
MTTYRIPTSQEFKTGAAEHYAFLVDAFGFAEGDVPGSTDSKFAACFWKRPLFVLVEGFSYGFALGTCIGKLGEPGAELDKVELSFLMRARRPDLLAARFGDERGQLEEMFFQAQALRDCASDFLAGDLSSWQSVVAAQTAELKKAQQESEAWERRQSVQRVAAQAGKAFRAGQYPSVVALLQPHEAALSKAESAMLKVAIGRSKNAA